MLNFKKITFENVMELAPYLEKQPYRLSEYSLAFNIMWQDGLQIEYAIEDGFLFLKYTYREGRSCFPMPVGEGDLAAALEKTREYAWANDFPLVYASVAEVGAETIAQYFPRTCARANRDSYDYLYLTEKLQTFSGKAYHGQKNHLNAFRRLYPDYQVEPMEPGHTEEVLAFLDRYEKSIPPKDGKLYQRELEASRRIIRNMAALPLNRLILRVEGNIIGISIAEVVGDTLFIHIEKALTAYRGAYQMLVSAMAQAVDSEKVKYCNREDDAGDMGLRTSKLAYHPIALLKKQLIEVQE